MHGKVSGEFVDYLCTNMPTDGGVGTGSSKERAVEAKELIEMARRKCIEACRRDEREAAKAPAKGPLHDDRKPDGVE